MSYRSVSQIYKALLHAYLGQQANVGFQRARTHHLRKRRQVETEDTEAERETKPDTETGSETATDPEKKKKGGGQEKEEEKKGSRTGKSRKKGSRLEIVMDCDFGEGEKKEINSLRLCLGGRSRKSVL